MRILMTGATGLIGSAVYRNLGVQHEVLTLGRRNSADLTADLTHPESIDRLQFGELDALVHCAGIVDEDFVDDPERAFRSAILGADALVGAAVAAGVKRLVYVSSAHVYGPMTGHKDETYPPDPRSNYAIAHYATEQVFKRRTSPNVAGLALRPCAVFGDLPDPSGFRRWSLIPFSFPREATQAGRIVINSTGEQRRNFVGTDDIADSIAQWLRSAPVAWSVINPLGIHTMSVFEFAQMCALVAREVTGRAVEVIRQLPDGPTPGDDFDYGSSSAIASGRQDLRRTLSRLIAAVEAET